jgi:hypothetical protein
MAHYRFEEPNDIDVGGLAVLTAPGIVIQFSSIPDTVKSIL